MASILRTKPRPYALASAGAEDAGGESPAPGGGPTSLTPDDTTGGGGAYAGATRGLDPAKREVLEEALVEVDEEIARIRSRGEADRASMLRALKKRYHPDSQRIMKWLYEAIFDHINRHTADVVAQ